MARTLQNVRSLDTPAESSPKSNPYAVGRTVRSYLRWAGNFTQDSGGSGAATAAEDGVARGLRNIHVKINGESIINSPGHLLYYLANYELGVAPDLTTPSPADAAASYAFAIMIPLLHASGDVPAAAPEIGQAKSISNVHNPEISIDYGQATDIATGGTRGKTLTSMTADLAAVLETSELPAQGERRMAAKSKNVAAAQTDFQIQLSPSRGKRLQRVLVYVRNNSVRSATLVTNLKIRNSQTNVFYDGAWNKIYAENKAKTKQTPPVGVVVIDFDKVGDLSNLPSMDDWKDFVIECNVGSPTGTADISVLVVTVEPPTT